MGAEQEEYFGYSILGFSSWIDRAQIFGYFVRTSLVAAGLVLFEFILCMGMSMTELVNVTNIFTNKIIESGDGTTTKIGWIFAVIWGLHFLACFSIGWKKFKKTIDGDVVALELFQDINADKIKNDERLDEQ